jgi:hypothetical protein
VQRSRYTGRLLVVLALWVALGLVAAAPASALFHLMKIREVSPETSPGANDAFVELQMYSAGQNQVAAHTVRFYNAAGSEVHNRALLGPNPPNGQSQRTILIGDTNTPGRDFTINDMSSEISFTGPGGAICFDETLIDCVSWGSFNNGGSQAGLPVGSPAPAIPSGMSLTRSIAGGCQTLLEDSDDTNNSSADFSLTSRTPRPNSVAPTETSCGGGGGGGGSGAPPQTRITRRPPQRTSDRTPTFIFRSSEAGSRFQCKLDGRAYRSCPRRFTSRRLSFGFHVLLVRAIDPDGNRDRTPARDTFRIVRP